MIGKIMFGGSLVLAAILAFDGPTSAQVQFLPKQPHCVQHPSYIPVAMRNLPILAEIPYTPGQSIGPLGPIDSRAADADYIRLGEAFWKAIDTCGQDTAGLTTFQWAAPELVALYNDPSGFQTQPDYWGGGLELFEAVHQHRLDPFTPGGPANIQELIEQDATVAKAFKHWTLHHQLMTRSSEDPVAHQRHRDMILAALGGDPSVAIRGVAHYETGYYVSDRLELLMPDIWILPRPLVAGGHFPAAISQDVAACIANGKGKLAGINGLYKPDGFCGLFGIGDTPGFDCDDFADALGAFLTKGKAGATATTVRVTWTEHDGNGKKGKGAHQVTKISSGGMYWLVDAQTGMSSGPHADDTPHDAGPIVGCYGPDAGSVHTSPDDRPLGDRPWFEPSSWCASEEIVQCFEDLTGFDADDFKPDAQGQ